jgi:2-(1,2-epoxy-1,2-dihydrophenyl)acetyl-CoA isomerase
MEAVLVSIDAAPVPGVLRVTLNRPEKLNAFNPAMHRGLAEAMALTGERIWAGDAERYGLIWKTMDDDKLMTQAEALAADLAAGPTRSLGLIKKAIYASAGNTLAAQLDLERDLQREIGKGSDYREGVAAFLEKRKPKFSGK